MIFKVRRHWQWLRFLSLIISNEMGGCIAKLFSPLLHPPHTSSAPVDLDRHPLLLAADLFFALSYCYIGL